MILFGSEWSISNNPPKKLLPPPIGGGSGGLGGPLISPSYGYFIGGLESVKILGVRGVLCMWQLVFASCHRLKSNKNNNNNNKGRNGTSHGHPVSYFLPIQAHSSNLEQFFSLLGYLGLFGAIQSYIMPFGVIWSHLESFGAIWCHLEPF